MTPDRLIDRAEQKRQKIASAVEAGQNTKIKVNIDEVAMLLRIPKPLLVKHMPDITYRAFYDQIAIIHGSPREKAVEGLVSLANDTQDKVWFASFAYDQLYTTCQGIKKDQGKSAAQGGGGLILDTLAEDPRFSGLSNLREYLLGGKAVFIEEEYEMLSGYLEILWDQMGQANQKDKNGRRPENVFR